MNLYGIILAAGEGKRMKSKIAKPLHKACSRAIIEYVLDAAEGAGSQKNITVVGHCAEQVREYLSDRCEFAYQKERLGTGHAVMQAADMIPDGEGTVMVLCGDAPLITAEILKKAFEEHISENRALTVITAKTENPHGYGRIIRNGSEIIDIVAEKDATDAEKAVCEIDSGMFFFKSDKLKSVLRRLSNDNAQGEYYLTDAIKLLSADGEKVGAFPANFENIIGVNDRVQLAAAEKILNRRNVNRVMLDGVTVVDPDNTYIDSDVKIGADTVIYPGCFIEGRTEIGEDCVIGPDTTLRNSKIGDSTTVERSVLTDSTVGSNTAVGPFAYMRPNSHVGSNVKIGDFVEVKNSSIDDGTKVAHLTYVGDADVGKRVNFGCGTVIVNYDGINKHRTTIGDDAFIGCNTNLVSPVRVNDGAYTAAGSTITDEVPENALAIARSRQVNKEDWVIKNGKRKNIK